MEEFAWIKDGVLLFDDYDMESQNLHSSFIMAGFTCLALVIDENGFLPDEIMSVYGYYLGNFAQDTSLKGKPLYFNQVPVPEYWEISSSNQIGEIHDLSHLRGRIRYAEPNNKRLVCQVDWLDAEGVRRYSDCYNQYGARYAKIIYDEKGTAITKSYFDVNGLEKIVENFVTGDIILNDSGKILIFRNKTQFVLDFMKRRGLEKYRLFYNSLSTPFFVSERLSAETGKKDILFWQEDPRTDIPGNMKIILEGRAARTEHIMVQKSRSYARLLSLGADRDKVHKLGYIYPFQKDNTNTPQALICTNSDNIEQLEAIVSSLPEMRFHIAALTEMSSKLLSIGRYENACLYPGVRTDVLDDLFDECDYYLDINHQNEIVSSVAEAFLSNQLILGFDNTIHRPECIADEHIYSHNEPYRMISDIKRFLDDETLLSMHIKLQHMAGLSETDYDVLKTL